MLAFNLKPFLETEYLNNITLTKTILLDVNSVNNNLQNTHGGEVTTIRSSDF